MGGEPWAEIVENQAGVVARSQLLRLGLTPRQSRRRLDTGHWRPAHPGVYFTFTGPVSDEAKVWAAVLYAGVDAAVGGRTALWLAGAVSAAPEPLEICVPHGRQVRPIPGVRFRRRRGLADAVHPAARPPRVRLEEAVLDVTADLDCAEHVVGAVLRVVQRRLTTADRLRDSLQRRSRHRWRSLIMEVLQEAEDGTASPLELRYARDVERAHGLPRGRRNQPERHHGARRYRDVRYDDFATVVELDGREAHPVEEAFRDLRRDNEVVLSGGQVLRYGYRDVVGRTCEVATQVGAALRAHGWRGGLRPCGANCTADISG